MSRNVYASIICLLFYLLGAALFIIGGFEINRALGYILSGVFCLILAWGLNEAIRERQDARR